MSVERVTLEDIVGEHPNGEDSRDRVVLFSIQDGQLWVTEGCDEWFSAQLTRDEVRKLIAWLTENLDGLK